MKRPPELFDREAEWEDLAAFSAPSPGRMKLGLVYGRRRQGKSFLLRALARALDGFYHQALEEERTAAQRRLGTNLAGYFGLPGSQIAIDSWEQAFDTIFRHGHKSHPVTVVLDEFPYLLGHSPELPSLIQRYYDEAPRAVSLIVCGSAISVMSKLLSGAQALRGRASLDLILDPFDYRDARNFWGIDDPELAFRLHSIVGGTPGYRDLLGMPAPSSVRGLAGWLGKGILNPSHALFREADYQLEEEPGISDRSLYHSVMAAISRGESTTGKIAAALGRDEGSVRHLLRMLTMARMVRADQDVLLKRRPTYRLTEPIVRFHHCVIRPNLMQLEERRAAEVWASAAAAFSSQIVGPHFEDLARTWTARYASEGTLGGPIQEVGTTTVNDPRHRTRHQIDVVAIAAGGRRPKKIRFLGEAKSATSPMVLQDLRRLEILRDLLDEQGRANVKEARLALFSKGGFAPSLKREARLRADVVLVDLDRIYEGS